MDFDFTPYFKKYEELLKIADQVFERMAQQYPTNVECRTGCADCCHALFDLTIIEALYLNHQVYIQDAQAFLQSAICDFRHRLP